MVTLLDSNGNELAICVEPCFTSPNRLVMGRVVRGKGNLLKHYFAQGRRQVQVDTEGFLLRGVLETRWLAGDRQWAVRLTPIAVAGTPIAESDGQRST